MAHIIVRNSLNNTLAVKLNVTFPRVTSVSSNDGDPRWVLEVATTYPSISGTKIPPYYVDTIDDSKTSMDVLLEDAVSKIASQINWLPLIVDNEKPFIVSNTPLNNTIVPIESNVYIDIKDEVPSAGLDMSEANIILNNGVFDFNITDECKVEGNPFYYTIEWKPTMREYKTYTEE